MNIFSCKKEKTQKTNGDKDRKKDGPCHLSSANCKPGEGGNSKLKQPYILPGNPAYENSTGYEQFRLVQLTTRMHTKIMDLLHVLALRSQATTGKDEQHILALKKKFLYISTLPFLKPQNWF